MVRCGGEPASGGHLRLNADGSGTLATYDARRIAGGYVAAFMVADPSRQVHAFQTVLARVPDDGTAPVILYRAPDTAASLVGPPTKEADFYNFVWNAWAVGLGSGNVYLAPDRDRPRILMMPARGGEPTEIKLVTGRHHRTAAEKAAAAARYARQGGGAGPEIADADPFVGVLRCDELGWVCVQTPSPEPPLGAGVFVAYDVYSEAGEYLHRVELRGPDDARTDNWFGAAGQACRGRWCGMCWMPGVGRGRRWWVTRTEEGSMRRLLFLTFLAGWLLPCELYACCARIETPQEAFAAATVVFSGTVIERIDPFCG